MGERTGDRAGTSCDRREEEKSNEITAIPELLRRLDLANSIVTIDARRVRRATIDIDSFPIPVHGQQQGVAYNGHYRDVTYHPLIASFCVDGHYDSAVRLGRRPGNGFLHAALRQGQVHTAHGM